MSIFNAPPSLDHLIAMREKYTKLHEVVAKAKTATNDENGSCGYIGRFTISKQKSQELIVPMSLNQKL